MKPVKRNPEMSRMQVFSMSGKTMMFGPDQQIEAARDKTWGAKERRLGPAALRSANDRACGSTSPAPVQEPVLGQPGVELLARNLEQLSRVGLVVAGHLQSPFDELTLGLFEGLVEGLGRKPGELAHGRGREVGAAHLAELDRSDLRSVEPHALRQIVQPDSGVASEGNRALDGIGEFAYVAWPGVPEQRGHRVLCDTGHRNEAPGLGIEILDEMAGEQRYVLGTLAQRENLDDVGLQPIVQILPQPA